jgi:hypothetical protein
MSGTTRGGVQPTVLATDRYSTQGMIGPNGFVQPTGDLTAVSFRFLNGLFRAVQTLEGQVATLQATVTSLQARLP